MSYKVGSLFPSLSYIWYSFWLSKLTHRLLESLWFNCEAIDSITLYGATTVSLLLKFGITWKRTEFSLLNRGSDITRSPMPDPVAPDNAAVMTIESRLVHFSISFLSLSERI